MEVSGSIEIELHFAAPSRDLGLFGMLYLIRHNTPSDSVCLLQLMKTRHRGFFTLVDYLFLWLPDSMYTMRGDAAAI